MFLFAVIVLMLCLFTGDPDKECGIGRLLAMMLSGLILVGYLLSGVLEAIL
jgi:hypothetical protein